MSTAPTVRQALAAASARLAAAGVESARRDAEVLLQHALGRDRSWLIGQRDTPLDGTGAAKFEAAVVRRVAREPVSHILGRREFWSLDFIVTADVLDPRPDTETLVEAVLRHAPAPARILDLGTGSGCILLALLGERPSAWGTGVDRSPAALNVAAANARNLGLADRATFVAADWGAALHARFDVIVSNPPYIPRGHMAGLEPEVLLHEPRAALDGGADGLDSYRRLLAGMPGLLADDGILALELGAGQADDVAAMARAGGLSTVSLSRDLAGIERCLVLRKTA